MGRAGEGGGAPGKAEKAEYRRLLEETDDAAGLVGNIEEDTVRLGELDESIRRTEEDTAAVK
jgi:hypothetical protein